MSTKLRGLLVLCGILLGGILFAQEKTVTGTVTDAYGFGVPDASVTSSSGQEVFTDMDGNYSITANEGDVLTIEALGLDVSTVTVGASDIYNATLRESGAIELEGAVVTALGITRDKKSLGYATQEISGEEISKTPVSNFADALSGEIAGLDITSSGTMGGSTNIIVRGYKSITGNNQALIVVDGTPINNNTYNPVDQQRGRGGYDYSNAASDINPNDIESVNVLKGAAATALYGSRGANGVVMITTKSGKRNKGIGVEVNSSVFVGAADKETLPKYQKQYGAGYGPYYASDNGYFGLSDVNGDGVLDLTTPFTEDASYGAAFDPNLMIYQWNSIYPQLPTYRQASPWVAGQEDPNYIWNISETYTNSVAFSGGNDKGAFRLGFTNFTQNGNLVNSKLLRNSLDFSGDYSFTDELTVSANISYVNNSGKGRVGTGYEGNNPMQSFRQWWQTNVDMRQQEAAFLLTGQNITWNPRSATDLRPIYTDNYFWNRANNYQTDDRNRYFGNVGVNYEFNDWISLLGRFAFDNYDETREERIAVGSAGGATAYVGEYSLFKQTVSENNYDLILNINKDLTDNINLDANAGWNLRVTDRNGFIGTTNGGLQVPGLYTLDNSINPLGASDMQQYRWRKMVDGMFARASVGFYRTFFVEGSIRTDRSSALPKNDNRYSYWSASGSFVFSELIDGDWLNFGKLRGNYAKVANDLDPLNVYNIYNLNTSFGSISSGSNPAVSNNPNLLPETTGGYELGLEMAMFKNRVSFDVSYYDNETEDLLTQIVTTGAIGATGAWANVGSVRNKGIEASLTLTPIRSNSFTWDIIANFAKNTSEVTQLAGDSEYYPLTSFQGGVEYGAWLNQPLGVLVGTNYVYDENGNKVVGEDGFYLTEAGQIIGDTNPEWTGGLKNRLSYKNLTLSFLIDVQQGGDVFSLDTWYGYQTGIYDFSAGLNDLGNPIRNSLENGGGVILPGVKEDGSTNDIRVGASDDTNPFGYGGAPRAAHVYDASFVKLRNVTLSYDLPESLIKNTFIQKFTISAIGRNLWIIHKNVPYSDPEAGLSAGNFRGYQSGAYPTIREIGASIKVEF
ncbi:SusC/RagA family TonB-linked outer membrane protein [Moheibacter lacus]|uniref:SusC/RagA family TonB-linked outer membrane protein n=1 Tax=Moheibacter lacus TaxID=2745851 RepID=A0A838ZSE5_9FLAO|nr:SusC/RagA family TonB-linked outer membrane protein [Moheibacter lacus]MBA5629609.1 SusC/RagA family TonB-linked outer membrane protein [Moheibacter lacus]